MGSEFDLPEPFASRGWHVKIRDRERVETPHATILFKTKAWRYGLREEQFLDREPDPNEIPPEILTHMGNIRVDLIQAWNAQYPGNPVKSRGERE